MACTSVFIIFSKILVFRFSPKSIGFFHSRSSIIINGCVKYEFDMHIGVAVTWNTSLGVRRQRRVRWRLASDQNHNSPETSNFGQWWPPTSRYRCNRLRCPLARLSGLQCFNMGHNGHGINLYGVVMILMGNLHAGGQSNLGHLSLVHRYGLLLFSFYTGRRTRFNHKHFVSSPQFIQLCV